MELAGKSAIVTGSTRGIGLAVAENLIAEKVNVVITARHEDDVNRTVERLIQEHGGKAIGTVCDLRDPDQVGKLIRICVDSFGGLDILINNAGIGIFKSVETMSPHEWRDVIATNLDGVFYCCHFALPEMKKNGGGFIINISSLAGKNPFATGSAYNASKHALTGFSEALMQEVRYDDIRVAYIMPGSVDTSFSGVHGKGESWKLSAQDVAGVVIDTLKRHPRCLTSRIEMRPTKPPKK